MIKRSSFLTVLQNVNGKDSTHAQATAPRGRLQLQAQNLISEVLFTFKTDSEWVWR